jgi:chemotaxis family two-component system sensor histidine kinase/response regulator PixL
MSLLVEKISTLSDMKNLMKELHRLETRFLCDFYGVLQDFSSKRLLPQWFRKKTIKNSLITDRGSEALSQIKKSTKLSIVIYELETPDLNGLEFLTERGNSSDLKSRCKVILMTPKLSIDVQNKLAHMGAAALVPKPLTEDDLQAAFERLGLDF